jgi:hypothetical protein
MVLKKDDLLGREDWRKTNWRRGTLSPLGVCLDAREPGRISSFSPAQQIPGRTGPGQPTAPFGYRPGGWTPTFPRRSLGDPPTSRDIGNGFLVSLSSSDGEGDGREATGGRFQGLALPPPATKLQSGALPIPSGPRSSPLPPFSSLAVLHLLRLKFSSSPATLAVPIVSLLLERRLVPYFFFPIFVFCTSCSRSAP